LTTDLEPRSPCEDPTPRDPDGFGSLTIKKQLTDIARHGLAVNIGANIGFNSAWL